MRKKFAFHAALLLIVAALCSADVSAQCKSTPKNIKWLSKLLRIKFPINEPQSIVYATKPSLIYEIPFAFTAYCSFVKAGSDGYFYLWSNKGFYNESTDYRKGDTIRFYFADKKIITSTCVSDYPGKKGQTISFYRLTREDLDQLATVALDSIMADNHLRLTSDSDALKKENQTLVLRRFSQRNVTRIKEWAGCLRKEL